MLKLYVWEDVLYDWTSGLAVALTHSAEEAKALLIANGIDEDHWQGTKLDGVEPDVYESPAAAWVYGGG